MILNVLKLSNSNLYLQFHVPNSGHHLYFIVKYVYNIDYSYTHVHISKFFEINTIVVSKEKVYDIFMSKMIKKSSRPR